jgi:hypothetical protein
MERNAIEEEIQRLKDRIIKLQDLEGKTAAERRGMQKMTREHVSKIIGLEAQKRCKTY